MKGVIKSAIVWMGLELTNENITVDLSSLSIHRSDLTGVSYEHYMLDSTGDMIALFPITNVTGKIQSFGLNTFPMIISDNLNDIIFLLNHPSRFITEAIQQAEEFDYTGYNIDFEPTQRLFRFSGTEIPRNSDQQKDASETVKNFDFALPGDLVFFKGHVAFYLGHGRIIHANGKHSRITETDLFDKSPYSQELLRIMEKIGRFKIESN